MLLEKMNTYIKKLCSISSFCKLIIVLYSYYFLNVVYCVFLPVLAAIILNRIVIIRNKRIKDKIRSRVHESVFPVNEILPDLTKTSGSATVINKITVGGREIPLKPKTRELICGEEIICGQEIGSGLHRRVYLAKDKKTKEKLAVKKEEANSKLRLLERDGVFLRVLQGGPGIPELILCRVQKNVNVLITGLLGPSLECLFSSRSRYFSLKTVLMLADQMIDRVEFVHSKFILHRYIKPDNFLMGLKKHRDLVYVTNFGLSKMYRSRNNQLHIPFRENYTYHGLKTYASVNTHRGIEQSRRDDLESLGYVLIYFLRGSLPWQDLKADNENELLKKITEMKVSTSIEALCDGYPPEFASYLHYCRSLRFDQEPDYAYLKRMFQDLFDREGFERDYVFDWTSWLHRTPSSHEGGCSATNTTLPTIIEE